MCGTACAPSTSTGMPRRCAARTMACTGFTVPSALDTCTTATIRVRSFSRCSYASTSSSPASVDRDDAQQRAALVAQHLPRHDVRVVLQRRDDDLVTAPHVRAAVALGDQVDGLGRAAHEDDLARVARVQKPADRGAGVFVRLGGTLAQAVHAAMDVRVLLFVGPPQAFDHHLRLLGGRGVVEVDQRPVVHRPAEQREVQADRFRVERRGRPQSNRGSTAHGRTLALEDTAERRPASWNRPDVYRKGIVNISLHKHLQTFFRAERQQTSMLLCRSRAAVFCPTARFLFPPLTR